MIHIGIVEDRKSDPFRIGRCKVRVIGVHTPNRNELPTADLPWAMPLGAITSANIDGIGVSPTGLVEGSTVLVVFLDRDQQIPVMLGTLPSFPLASADPTLDTTDQSVLPYKPGKPINQDAWSNEESVLVDSSGNPVTNTYSSIDSMIVSEAGFNMLRSEEGLASLSPDRTVIGKNSTPAGTTIYAYKDTKSIWTIGWGSTYLADGSKVLQTTTMTKAQADSLLELTVNNSFAKDVKRFLGVPVTQAMFDTLVCLAYNMGSSGLRNTDFWRELNKGNYKAAADLLPSTKTNNGTLTPRRTREKSHFLSEGIPQNSKVDK